MVLRGRRLLVASALLVAAALTTQFALGQKKDTPAAGETMRMPMPMDSHKRAVHALIFQANSRYHQQATRGPQDQPAPIG